MAFQTMNERLRLAILAVDSQEVAVYMTTPKNLPVPVKIIWSLSLIITVLMFSFICYDFYSIKHYPQNPETGIGSKEELDYYLTTAQEQQPELKSFSFIPTGLFIQSLHFRGPYTLHVSGYVWQQYTLGKHDHLTRGFQLPESIDQKTTEVYRNKDQTHETIGWYFEGSLLESFDYSKYPLDEQIAWLRLWHADFNKNVILTPDFDSYTTTVQDKMFGLDSQIELDGFHIQRTYFNYHQHPYNTNFGLSEGQMLDRSPELYFNVALSRNFTNGFTLHALPVILVVLIAFALCMNLNSDRSQAFNVELNIVTVISACSALTFAMVLILMNLRRGMIGGEINFIESIYLLAMAMIAMIGLNAMAIAKPNTIFTKLLGVYYYNNIFIKALYWPFFLLGIIILSQVFLH